MPTGSHPTAWRPTLPLVQRVLTGFIVISPYFAYLSRESPNLFLLKILIRRHCMLGSLFLSSLWTTLASSEGSPVSPCICCGLCLGVITDNKIISNGQENSSSNQVGKLLQCQTEKCSLRVSGNEVHSAGTQGAPGRDLHQSTIHWEHLWYIISV